MYIYVLTLHGVYFVTGLRCGPLTSTTSSSLLCGWRNLRPIIQHTISPKAPLSILLL